ncbi:hypothetical protein [Haloarchaeobius sp. DT45]|uniref:hypothetical protein n=1 Tax=Haloarchaeobius sp. DT45 TaxID=3446116 RepID=UPI003F6BECB4
MSAFLDRESDRTVWVGLGVVLASLVVLALFEYLGSLVFGWYGLFLGPLVVVLVVDYGDVVFPELAGRLTLG